MVALTAMSVDFRRRGVGDNAKGSGRMAAVDVQLPRGNDPRGGSYPWGFYSQVRPSDSEGDGPFPACGVDGGGDGEEVMILAATTLGMVATSGSLRPDPTM
uniref:Uncharacterized protein n=1 Tax=Oryza glumipatula TaxID=40148 RepID=A0A0E0ACR4_9ORYZ